MDSRDDTNRDLLIGLLALQNGLVDQDALIRALRAWTRDKSRPIAALLADQGAIAADELDLLEEHIRRHGGDAEKSLAAIKTEASLRNDLAMLGEAVIDGTIGHAGGGFRNGPRDGTKRTTSYASATDPSDGQRFRVLRPHARGGLGAVYVALDAELNREVALKLILDHHADDPNSRMRFVLEAEITGGLEHPGIVPVYGLGNDRDGRPYYAMRFIRGDSLKQTIAAFHTDNRLKDDPGRRSLELRKLLRRFVDVCNAIDYAHTRGVLHRDIKPANVVVGEHGETLVVDWGLAKTVGRAEPGPALDERILMPSPASGSIETLPGSAIGTPAYMSPEQAKGALDRVGPWSDVYSLGATLYCLLTGRPPFEKTDVEAVLKRVGKGDFPPPRKLDPTIDAALEAVCLKAMALDPNDRYPTARALADDIERWTADEPVAAWREPWDRRVRRWARRHRTSVSMAAVAVLAAVAGLLVVLVVQARANEALKVANAREKQANTELAAAKDREAARFNLAMNAIGVFHGGISRDFLLQKAEFVPLRDRLLKQASEFYRELEAELGSQSDPRSQKALGQAYLSLGQLTMKVGSSAEATAQLRRSVAIRRQLATGPNPDAESRAELGQSLFQLGQALVLSKDPEAALAAYQEAVAIFEDLAASLPTRLAHREELAQGLLALSNVGSDRDSAKKMALVRRAVAILEALVREDPSHAEHQLKLARALFDQAYQLTESKREYGEAVVFYQRAAALIESNARDGLDGADDLNVLASLYNNLAVVFGRMGRSAERKEVLDRMIAIRRSLVAMSPGVSELQNNLAHGIRTLARDYANSGRIDEALSTYASGRELLEFAIKAHPKNLMLRSQLSNTLLGTAWTLQGSGRYAEALTFSEQELVIRDELVRAAPSEPLYQNNLANCLNNTATLLIKLGRASEAWESSQRAIALLEALSRREPGNHDYREHLAEGYLRSGEIREARGDREGSIADWKRAAGLYQSIPGLDGEDTFFHGCCRARLASLAGDSADFQAQAAAAMDLLRRAVATEYRNPHSYRNERALDALRTRPDFQLLMMDLEFPVEPFTPGN